MDFVIPVTLDELQQAGNSGNHFYVEKILPADEVQASLRMYQTALRAREYNNIVQHFNAFYSVLIDWQKCDSQTKEIAFETLLKAVTFHQAALRDLLSGGVPNGTTKRKEANCVKMLAYLLAQAIEVQEVNKSRQAVLLDKGKGRKKAGGSAGSGAELNLEKATTLLRGYVEIDVHTLFEPPVLDPQFVNVVTQACYRLLETPTTVRNATLVEQIFAILGTAVRRHNHAVNAPLKTVQLLQNCSETCAEKLVGLIEHYVHECGARALASDIIQEICETENMGADTNVTHAYSRFLVVLAERLPSIVLENRDALQNLLSDDPYSMRLAVITVIGTLIKRLFGSRTKHLASDESAPTQANDQRMETENEGNTGAEGEEAGAASLTEVEEQERASLFSMLTEHVLDVNAHVRARVLQTWLLLVQSNCVPFSEKLQLLDTARDALLDVCAAVRRFAVKIIAELSTPAAAGGLARLEFEELGEAYSREIVKLKELKARIRERRSVVRENLNATLREQGERLDASFRARGNAHDKSLNSSSSETEANPDSQACRNVPETETDVDPERERLTRANERRAFDDQYKVTKFLKVSLRYATKIRAAVEDIAAMLGSTATTDVLEAIDFFIAAHAFQFREAAASNRRVLALIFAADSDIQLAALNAFYAMHLRYDSNTRQLLAPPSEIAADLIALLSDASLSHITAIHRLIAVCVDKGAFEPALIAALWQVFSNSDAPIDHRRAAVRLLGMASSARPDIIRDSFDVIRRAGLDGQVFDYRLALACLDALELCATAPTGDRRRRLELAASRAKRGADKQPEPSAEQRDRDDAQPSRLAATHPLLMSIARIVVATFADVDHPQAAVWTALMKKAVSLVYLLGEHCDTVATNLIRETGKALLGLTDTNANRRDAATDADGDAPVDDATAVRTVDSRVFARFAALCGQVALKQLIHLNVYVLGELQIRERRKHSPSRGASATTATKRAGKTAANTSRRSASSANANASTVAGTGGAQHDEEALMAGNVAEGLEVELIRDICERQLVVGNSNLLARIAPVITSVTRAVLSRSAADGEAAALRRLQQDEVLLGNLAFALGCFMLVSSEFCEANLQLLFTLLERVRNEQAKTTIVALLGDLARRYPNLVQPWNATLFARLRDASATVREATLVTLSHLILSDMLRASGHLGLLAGCLLDADERVRQRASVFFKELSGKSHGNEIYNQLPDIYSALTDPANGFADEQQFRSIVTFLFGFVNKDRQHEALVDKFCARFDTTVNDRQRRDLMFCLSLFNYANERTLGRLHANLPSFQEHLRDPQTYELCLSIVTKTRRAGSTLAADPDRDDAAVPPALDEPEGDKQTAAAGAGAVRGSAEQLRRILDEFEKAVQRAHAQYAVSLDSHGARRAADQAAAAANILRSKKNQSQPQRAASPEPDEDAPVERETRAARGTRGRTNAAENATSGRDSLPAASGRAKRNAKTASRDAYDMESDGDSEEQDDRQRPARARRAAPPTKKKQSAPKAAAKRKGRRGKASSDEDEASEESSD